MKQITVKLTRTPAGRVLLHVGCLLRGGPWRWHWQGIRRDLARRPFFPRVKAGAESAIGQFVGGI